MPGVIAVTIPEGDILAVPLDALHTPPGAELTRVVTVPAHIMLSPDIVPATAGLFTVTGAVAETVPQPLVTE
jgi:hypothetical protein